MEAALGTRFLKRFLAIVIFLGCATFVAYRQRLSKIDISQILHPEKLGLFLSAGETYRVGWFKNPVSSQTDKLMAGTKFSDYLGLKHYKKAKKIKHFIHLNFAYRPQSLSTYHSISPTVNSGHRLKKYVPVM